MLPPKSMKIWASALVTGAATCNNFFPTCGIPQSSKDINLSSPWFSMRFTYYLPWCMYISRIFWIICTLSYQGLQRWCHHLVNQHDACLISRLTKFSVNCILIRNKIVNTDQLICISLLTKYRQFVFEPPYWSTLLLPGNYPLDSLISSSSHLETILIIVPQAFVSHLIKFLHFVIFMSFYL